MRRAFGAVVQGRPLHIGGLPPYGKARAWVIWAITDADPRAWSDEFNWWTIQHVEPVRAYERVELLRAEARRIGFRWVFPLFEAYDAAVHGPLHPHWRPFPPLAPETAAIQAASAAAQAEAEPYGRARDFYQRAAIRLAAYAARQPDFEMAPDAPAPGDGRA